MLPLRSLFLALFLVFIPALLSKLGAQPLATTHYQGDPGRRPLDGSYRNRTDTLWSASKAYRANAAPLAEHDFTRERMPVTSYAGERFNDRYDVGVNQPHSGFTYDGVPVPAPIWSGLYGGVHGGGGWGSLDIQSLSLDLSGSLIGAHIGYLIRSGALVAGIELDADLSQIHETKDFGNLASFIAEVDWLASARARIGVLAGPALFYATGGVALVGLSAKVGALGQYASTSFNETALVAGGGVEIGLGETVSLRLEALHYFFDDVDFTMPGFGNIDIDRSLTTVRLGLTFFFN